MKVLAIGNSFSQDELSFLHQIAKGAGRDITCANLYIGGCSLEQHMENIKNNAAAYEYLPNGSEIGSLISIDDALKKEEWDVVYTHQASALSGFEWTYYPYLPKLIKHIERLRPDAAIYLDETWAYEHNSDHEGFKLYKNDQKTMYKKVSEVYKKVAAENKLPLIPCGSCLQEIRSLPQFDITRGGMSLHRDGFHMHLVYGRYLMGCVMYEALTGANVLYSDFVPHIEGFTTDESIIKTIKHAVHEFMVR